jgi:hypothetical protein
MKKTFGAKERHDQLIVYGKGKKAVLIYGYGEEDGQGYDWRQVFTHRPTKQEVLDVIVNQINADTDNTILTGFVWNDKKVWLSRESQFNFKAAYDLAVQNKGKTLPVKFKLGEDDDKLPIYHTFEAMAEFTDFYTNAISFINQTLNEGWEEKDAAKEWVDGLDL